MNEQIQNGEALEKLRQAYLRGHDSYVDDATMEDEFEELITQIRRETIMDAACRYPTMLRDMVTRGSVNEWLLHYAENVSHNLRSE